VLSHIGSRATVAAGLWQVLTGSIAATELVSAAEARQPRGRSTSPCRQALVTALVPRDVLLATIALLNPSREVAVLTGPAIGGLLIAVDGLRLTYLLDGITYADLVRVLLAVRVPPLLRAADAPCPRSGRRSSRGSGTCGGGRSSGRCAGWTCC
jgi:hypothetical protein